MEADFDSKTKTWVWPYNFCIDVRAGNTDLRDDEEWYAWGEEVCQISRWPYNDYTGVTDNFSYVYASVWISSDKDVSLGGYVDDSPPRGQPVRALCVRAYKVSL